LYKYLCMTTKKKIENMNMDELKKKEKEMEKIVEDAEKYLADIRNYIGARKPKTMRYNWSELAVKYIKQEGVLLQSTDIFHFILKNDAPKDEAMEVSSIVALSIALNNLCSNGVLRKLVVQGVKGHFFGLPEWFNDNDTIDNKYLIKVAEKVNKATKPVYIDKKKIAAKLN
jgi:hypothetical protein